MWYSSRSFAVSAVGMMLGWLACLVSNFMILSFGVFAGAAILPRPKTPR
jgi:hypothetical protein